MAGVLANNAGLGYIWPYSLMMLSMNSNKTEDVMTAMGDTISFYVSVILFFLLFAGAAIWLLKTEM